jgi:hypothetical protein
MESETFFAALAHAQGEMTGATKDSKNPHFKSNYASLASVVDVVRAPLARHGIAWTQRVHIDGTSVGVETVLMWRDQQFGSGLVRAVAKDTGPQSIGSVVTYLRRYSLMATLGIPAEDDDGEGATRRDEPTRADRPERREQPAARQEPHPLDTEPASVDIWLDTINKAPIASRDAASLEALRRVLAPGGQYLADYQKWKASNAAR